MTRIQITAALVALLLCFGTPAALAKDEAPAPVSEAVPDANSIYTLRGVVKQSGLEGGFYTVEGWGLKGDQALFASLEGQEVVVRGTEFDGIHTWMVKSISVQSIARALNNADLPLPQGVTVMGKTLAFDQGPEVLDGVLMLPVRAVAEAAGGAVHWDGSTQTVSVSLPDRTVQFYVGQPQAELNENGVYYLTRNLLPLAKAPIVKNGRTLISADAVSGILGLLESVDGNAQLDLVRREK